VANVSALHLSSALYKSPCFLQNKANFKMGNINISTARPKAYANEQQTMSTERYQKQTQSNPIPPPPENRGNYGQPPLIVHYLNFFLHFFGGIRIGAGRARRPSVTIGVIDGIGIPMDVSGFGDVIRIGFRDPRGSSTPKGSSTYSEWNGDIVRMVSGFLLWFLALNVGCIAAIIAGVSLVA